MFHLIAAALSLQPNLTDDLEKVLSAQVLEGAIVSAIVTDADGLVLYSKNSSTRVMPASNQKLLSTLFAFDQLGPDFVPVTKFAKKGRDIFVESTGDPSLTSAQLKAIGGQLKPGRGSKVFVKATYRPGYGPSWEWDDLPNKYAPRISAFSVDEAAFSFKLVKGQPEPIPKEFHVKMIQGSPQLPFRMTYDQSKGQISVQGKWPAGDKVLDTLALPNPEQSAAELLGGSYAGATDAFPTDVECISVPGTPLRTIFKDCLVKSDNHHAEHLLLMAAGAKTPLPTEAEKCYPEAAKRLKDFLSKTIVNADDFRPQDGSGLSRHNYVTTRGVSQLLVWAERQPWFEDFFNSLVSAGAGTLAGRNPGASFHGKTGTLDGVVALSGYLKNTVGKTLIVSVIFNHSPAASSAQRAVIDEFVRVLELSGSSGTNHAHRSTNAVLSTQTISNMGSRALAWNRVDRPRLDSSTLFSGQDR
ncbi:MAG: D-alanyl-D-alanine carboxypeptidase [Armatimonadetes bacterium]|nr:D-alanyl-D-alanine carboxypeptidase [Armatimonadota bacterium]